MALRAAAETQGMKSEEQCAARSRALLFSISVITEHAINIEIY
jgi:hypothetical protein